MNKPTKLGGEVVIFGYAIIYVIIITGHEKTTVFIPVYFPCNHNLPITFTDTTTQMPPIPESNTGTKLV
jgi:hypothetical protein